jgi:adenylate kinase family enzyme
MNRFVIVGTTLACELSRRIEAPHIELDALNWGPNWTAASTDVFRAKAAEAVSGERWVIDGNYQAVRDLVWSRADCIVWLNYSFSLVLRRLLKRTARRVFLAEPCCNGNRESLRLTLSKDSILLWALTTYHRRRRKYPALLAEREVAGTCIVEHKTPAETKTWLQTVGQAASLPLASPTDECISNDLR